MRTVLLLLGLCAAAGAAAQPSDEEDLAQAFGDGLSVSIATGARQPLARAPAVATVITAADILALGATDLDQVLETVPGLHVNYNPNSYAPRYLIRGVSSNFNAEVLILVNGIPMTTAFLGDRGNVWMGLPLENVARIEVVRGPGSALYGAEAMSGVINIITKGAADIPQGELGVRGGSHRTGDGWLLAGGRRNGLDASIYLRAGATRGQRGIVERDRQSAFDDAFGTSASLAPGPVRLGYQALDGQLDVGYGKWRWRAGYKLRDNAGPGVGVADALDPVGSSINERITTDLTWREQERPHWDLQLQASYFHMTERSQLLLFPPGADIGTGAFAEGMIGNPEKWEYNVRLTATAAYSGFARHRLAFGTGWAKIDLYRTRESKNFSPAFVPLGAVVDVSDTVPFLTPHERFVRHAFLQDEWNFARDWTLTAGVRHDRYSDFGGSTNPRLALVWDAAYNLTAKLMYGRSFRAPTFTELYNVNNPVAVGNPDLKPETAGTTELALAWQALPRLRTGINFFRIDRRNVIEQGIVTDNSGAQRSTGLEAEFAWDATRDWRLAASYSHQRTIDRESGAAAGFAPRNRLYGRADWRFAPGWLANAQLNWVMDRRRTAGDPRPATPDYRTLDLTLRRDHVFRRWNLALSVRNLFDADAREPAPATIPEDLPLPGRTLWGEVRLEL